MKLLRKVSCIVAVIAITMGLSLSVFAQTSNSVYSDTYGTVIGSNIVTTGGAVRVSTTATRNPDKATLRNSAQFSTGTQLTTARKASSSAGATSLTYDFEMITTVDNPYVYVFCGHEVYLSTSSAVYFQTDRNLS